MKNKLPYVCYSYVFVFFFTKALKESLQGIGNIYVTNNTLGFHSGIPFGVNSSSQASSFEDWQTPSGWRYACPLPQPPLDVGPCWPDSLYCVHGFSNSPQSQSNMVWAETMCPPWVLWRQPRSCYSLFNPSPTQIWSLWSLLPPQSMIFTSMPQAC